MKKTFTILITLLYSILVHGQITISSPNEVEEGENYQIQVTLDEPLEKDLYLFFDIEHQSSSHDDFNVNNDLMNGVYYVVDGTPVDDFTDSPFDINRHMFGMDGDTIYYEKTDLSLHKFNLFNGEIFVTDLTFNNTPRDIYFKNNRVYIVRDLPTSDIIEVFDNNFNLLEQVNFPESDNYDNGGIEVNNNGDMYTSQGGQHRILKFVQSTDSWSVFLHENENGEEIFFNITDIQLINDNTLLVVDQRLGVSLWDLEGNLLGSNYLYGYPSPHQKIDVNNNKMIISYEDENIVYSTKLSYLNECPDKMWYSNDSEIIMGEIDSSGDEVNELDSPWDVEIDSKGVVYVVDHENGSIKYKFTRPTIKIPSGQLTGNLELNINSDSRIEGNENFNLTLKGTNNPDFNEFNWSNNTTINDLTENIEFTINSDNLNGIEGTELNFDMNFTPVNEMIVELSVSGQSTEGDDYNLTSNSSFEIFDLTNSNLTSGIISGSIDQFRNGYFHNNILYLLGSGSTEIFKYDLESKEKVNLLLCNTPVGVIDDISITENDLFFTTDLRIYQLDLTTSNLTILFENPDYSNGERYNGIDIFNDIIYVTTQNSSEGFEGITKYDLSSNSVEKISIPLVKAYDIQVTQNNIYILDNNVKKYNHSLTLLNEINIPGNGNSRGFYISKDEESVYLTKLSSSGQSISTLYKVLISDNSHEIIFDNSSQGGRKMWGIIPSNNGDNFYITSQNRLYKYLKHNYFKLETSDQTLNVDLSLLQDNINEEIETNFITPIFHLNTNVTLGDEFNFTIEDVNLSLMDTDNDGVTDDIDTCPNTPNGDTVDSNGCSSSQLDTDNDGVTDDIDTCPNTPNGDTVDSNGCSSSQLDTDNDGVTDDIDTCPNTPNGDTVDSNGCSSTQLSVDNEILGNFLKLYPNPSTNILTIESKNSEISKVEIYTVLGQKIKDIYSKFNTIRTDNLTSGVYILKIYFDKVTVSKKIFKR